MKGFLLAVLLTAHHAELVGGEVTPLNRHGIQCNRGSLVVNGE